MTQPIPVERVSGHPIFFTEGSGYWYEYPGTSRKEGYYDDLQSAVEALGDDLSDIVWGMQHPEDQPRPDTPALEPPWWETEK